MLRACFLIALAVTACGDNAPSDDAPPGLPAIARLTLDVPPGLAPGAQLPIRWSVENATDTQRVVLRLFAPGVPTLRTSAGYVFTGSAPATTYAGAIAADGTLSDAEVAIADPATAGELALTLPSEAEGDWAVVATLLDGEQVVDIATATTWRAAHGVRLDLSRVWASTDSLVRIGVRATGEEPMRLSAWLTLPDGTIASLPGVVNSYLPVVEGDLPAELPPLFHGQLGVHGPGRYLVSARLETLTGEPRGSAGATIQVCDEPGTIAGLAAASDPVVAAIGLADHQSVTTAPAGDGSFSLTVPPGDWLVTSASGAERVEVGCGQTVALQLATTAARSRARPTSAPATPPVPHHVDHEPSLRFLVVPSTSGDDTALVAEYAASQIMKGRPGFSALTKRDVERALGLARDQMLAGTDKNLVNTEMLTAADFLVDVKLTSGSDRYTLFMTLIDVHKVEIVHTLQVNAPSASRLLELIDANIAAFLGDLAALRRRVDVLADPVLEVKWDKDFALGGETVTAQVSVSDAGTRKSVSGVAVTLRITMPDGAKTTIEGTTSAAGSFFAPVTVPASAGAGAMLQLGAFVVRRSGREVPSDTAVLMIQGAMSSLRMRDPVLRAHGDRTEVSVQIPASSGDEAGVVTEVVSTRTTQARLDSAGRARLEVFSEATLGRSKVTVSTPALHGGGPPRVHAVTYGYVVEPLALTAFVEPSAQAIDDHVLEVRGVATLDGVPMPSLPLHVELDGEGSVVHGGFTDSAGRMRVYWRAPATGEGTSTIRISVVKDAYRAEQTVTVGYAPACASCPLIVTPSPSPSVAIGKNEQRLFTANQDVSWSVTDGSIDGAGLFTAPPRGGVVHLVATSVQDPQKTVTVPIVVDCDEAEMYGAFSGTLATVSGTPAPPFGCAGGSPAVVVEHWGLDGKELVAKAMVCPSGGQMLMPMNFSGLSCVAVYQETAVGVCIGELLRVTLTPDLTTPGNLRRHVDVIQRDVDGSLPLGSACRDVWHGEGVYTK